MSDGSKASEAQAVSAARAQHKRTAVVEFPDGSPAAFRQPTRAEYDSWLDSGRKAKDTRTIVLDCLVYPSREAFTALIDEWPAVLHKECSDAVLELAGLGKAKRG